MMNKYKKKLIAIICIVVIIIGAVFIYQYAERQREVAREIAIEQQRIANAYSRVNVAFAWGETVFLDWESLERYKPLEAGGNPFGVHVSTYALLLVYYHRAGITLAYETVVDYFSQEFEPDGSLRLYNNGMHPEIYAFVTGEWIRAEQIGYHWRRMRQIYIDYSSAHRDAGFIEHHISELSPQMLIALARAHFDPDYALDLTSIQQAGY